MPIEARKENMTEREIAIQLITLMAHIEGISEENQLVPPVNVHAVDQSQLVWDFDYDSEWDSADVLPIAPKLPVDLRLVDSTGKVVETRITDLTLRPEWLKRFLQ